MYTSLYRHRWVVDYEVEWSECVVGPTVSDGGGRHDHPVAADATSHNSQKDITERERDGTGTHMRQGREGEFV